MSEIIDINVSQQIDEVTINVTEEVITVNINKITGGGGGSQNLNQVLEQGNETDGQNIALSNGDSILLDNGSRLVKGTSNAGLGGNNGIAFRCSIDYEFKWEAGRLYVMEQDGFTIREVSHNFTFTPALTDDVSKGFVIGSRWILDNGDVYICTDAALDSAVWEIESGGGTWGSITGTLSDQTDLQNALDNKVDKVVGKELSTNDFTDALETKLNGIEAGAEVNVNADWNAISGDAQILNKPAIPTNTSDLTNDGADGVNPFITALDITVDSVNGQTGVVVLDADDIDDTLTTNKFVTAADLTILSNTSGVNTGDQDLTGLVPYTGATSDVNLGEFGLQTGNIEFDLTPTAAPTTVGSMVWNDSAGTVDLKLKGGNVTLQIGQETVARVVNKTATNITLLEANYQVVRITGAQGGRPKVDLALADNDLNSTTTLGIVTETILNNQEGFITTSGQVQQINTTGSLQGETWADGDVLYLSGTVAGRLTNIKPAAPIHTVIMGIVEYAHITQGKIFVKVDNGYELEELHNVSAIAPNNNEVLTYDTASLLWKPKTVSTALGYTPVNQTRLINTTSPLLGGGDLSADRTLSIQQATSLQAGYLSSTDWSTFNNKQAGDATLTALAAYNTNGILTQTSADTFTGRTITGTTNQVTVTNGSGVAGNPTLSLPQDIHTAAAPQFARLGLGAAANLASYLNVIANTSTVGQIYFPPSAVDYTGTLSGMLWNNTSEWKFYDGVLGSVNRLLKLNGNTALANANALNVVTSTGTGGNLGTLKAEVAFSRYPTAVSYTVLLTDVGFGWIIAVTSTAAARTITLPPANTVTAGFPLTVKDESGGALTNNITIARAGADTIDGATSNVINLNYGSRTVYSDGVSKWFII